VIDTRSNIRLASSTPSQLPKPSIDDNATLAAADAAVRNRAYELYELGGRVDGRAEENWYQAESDLRAGEREDGVSTNVRTKPGKALRQSSAT
jgi:Protein of unknown function (DUF2934)